MTSIRLALRKLIQQPLFSILAIGTLGLGIGFVTTCFSAVNTLLFRPLPGVEASDRIVVLSQTRTPAQSQTPMPMGFNLIDATVAAERSPAIENIWLYSELTVIMEGERTPLRFLGSTISAHAFDRMGVEPILGRNLLPSDNLPAADAVALISHQAWQERFQSRPDAIGTTLLLNGVPSTIVGVMPPRWRYPATSDVWLPFSSGGEGRMHQKRGVFQLKAHGLLAPGATIEDAQDQLSLTARELARAFPETNSGIGMIVNSWRKTADQEATYFTVLLFAAGFGIFLIACANVANLQLSRGSARAPEIAVRIALGATRWQIFRQLLVENVVLGILGAMVGSVVSLWGIDLVLASSIMDHPFWFVLDPDWRVLGFTVSCGLLAGVIFGLVPALRGSQPDLIAAMKEGSRTGIDQGPYGMRLRNVIVIGEIAVALVLLVGAGLMTRSFRALQAVDLGYTAENVLTFRVGFPFGYEADSDVVQSFYRELPGQLEGLNEVSAAAAITLLPGDNDGQGSAMLLPPPSSLAEPSEISDVCFRTVTPNYFDTLEIPLIAGRDFSPELEISDGPLSAIVDAAFVYASGLKSDDIIGRKVSLDGQDVSQNSGNSFTIIGVVGSIQHRHDEIKRLPTFYFPQIQSPSNFMSVVLRTKVKPELLEASVRHEVLTVHAGMPIYSVFSLEQVILRSIWEQYFFSRMFLCVGLVAVLLACVSIYGVMTFSVTMRQQEIGLRMALGATAQEVVRDVVRRGSQLVVFGLGAGFIAAFLLANLLSGFLHGVTPHDPPTFITVPIILAVVALLACYLSSRRATRINPMTAMRSE